MKAGFTLSAILFTFQIAYSQNSFADQWLKTRVDFFKQTSPSFSVEPEDVLKAKCKPQTLTTEYMESQILSYKNEPRQDYLYTRSLNFYNEAAYLYEAYNDFYGSHLSLRDFKHCNSVICLFETTQGSRNGILQLYLLTHYRLNTDAYAFKYQRNKRGLTSDNLEYLLKTMTYLPTDLFLGGKTSRVALERPEKNARGPSKITSRNIAAVSPSSADLSLTPIWERLGKSEAIARLTHEIAHIVDVKNGGLSRAPEWEGLSDWRSTKHGLLPANLKEMLSRRALWGPAEDFAETFAAYRFSPKRLKQKSPKKYNYMKKLFKGKEYLNSDQCH